MKKILLSFMMTLLPLAAMAYDAEVDGIYYNLSGTEAEVTYNTTAYNSYSGNVIIPSSITYNGTTYSVTSIGDFAFWGCSGLSSITIPESVTSIGGSAFWQCRGLKAVYISDLKAWCNISFNDGGSNPLSCAYHLYLNGEEIEDMVIPDDVTSIGNHAFSFCKGLTSVTIPDGVTSIGERAFHSCPNLSAVHISDLKAWCNISFNNETSNPLSWAHHLYLNGVEVKDLVIPADVTSIGNYAFYRCSGMTSITIPDGVTSIGNMAFYDCNGLTSITIPESVTSIGAQAFQSCSSLTSIAIPEGVTSISLAAFLGCSGLTSITIPSSVTSIGAQAFFPCI